MILTFKQKLWLILVLVITLSALYLLYGIGSDVNKFLIIYMVNSRYKRLLAILLTAVCVGASTLIFQTISNNRILTPSIIGLDSVYVFIQTIMLFFLGSQQTLKISALSNYCLSLLIMVGFAFFLFKVLFKQQEYSIYFVLLSVQIMQILRRLVKDFNKTIILVIHDINFASCYADNIVALKEGKIIVNGNVDEVVKEEVLSKIYDMPIKIETYQGRKICNYFDPQEQIHCETAHKLLSK